MQLIASRVETWILQRRRAAVVRPISTVGLGPRPADDVLLVDDAGHTSGSLLGGVVQAEVVAAAGQLLGSDSSHDTLWVDIDSADATACGLTCGGRVEILVQRLDVIPTELWDTLAAGRPAALATALGTSSAPLAIMPGGLTIGALPESALDTLAQAEAEPLLRYPGASAARVPIGDVELVVEAWNPVPRLVVVGASELSVALTRQVELLGWTATTCARRGRPHGNRSADPGRRCRRD